LRIDARYLEVRNYSHENIKKIIVNYPVYTLTHRVRFCLRLKQRRRALTVNHIGYLRTFIHKGQVVTSVIALWMGVSMQICVLTLDVGWSRK